MEVYLVETVVEEEWAVRPSKFVTYIGFKKSRNTTKNTLVA